MFIYRLSLINAQIHSVTKGGGGGGHFLYFDSDKRRYSVTPTKSPSFYRPKLMAGCLIVFPFYCVQERFMNRHQSTLMNDYVAGQ